MGRFFEKGKCPICSAKYSSMNTFGRRSIVFDCRYCGAFGITHDILAMPYEKSEFLFKCINLMHSFLISHQRSTTGLPFVFFYVEGYEDLSSEPHPELYINLYDLMNRYPDRPSDKLVFVLNNLHHRFPEIGRPIEYYSVKALNHLEREISDGKDVSLLSARTFWCMTNIGWDIYHEIHQTVTDLEELQYIKPVHPEPSKASSSLTEPDYFTISLKGRELLHSMERDTLKQGFIAISFADQSKPILEAIVNGISNANYVPMVISSKEYNGQIVPEIFYEISRSSFVVMDSTYPNYGAYYEAGYAKGLKIPVIFTCKREVFDGREGASIKPHFDIRQENHIIWKNEEDLTNRLQKRIEATLELQQI